MKQVILIHGSPEEKEFYDPSVPSPSNTHWFPWIQKQLALYDVLCQSPEFPKPFDPVYESWVSVFEQYLIDTETVLVGHSSGGGFILRYLSEHPNVVPRRVILVAPWLDPEKELSTPFFDFVIDAGLATRTDLQVFVSSDDENEVLISCKRIREMLPNATYHEFTDREHFCTPKFPELLETIEK
jgi:predicted alpha/beta hydrolase family esterase